MEDKGVVLGYWAIRGLGERCRHLLEYCKVPYTQQFYQNQEGREKFINEVRPKLMEKNPAVTLPYLVDGDKIISQSDAIYIYICHRGKKPELVGRNPEEQVLMATVHGVYKDLYPRYIRLVYGKYENDDAFKKAVEEAIKDWEVYLKKFNGILGDKEFLAGGLTWVDFEIADFMQVFNLLSEQFLKPFPRLHEHQKRVWALPELKDYFSSDRWKERPCNNYPAHWK